MRRFERRRRYGHRRAKRALKDQRVSSGSDNFGVVEEVAKGAEGCPGGGAAVAPLLLRGEHLPLGLGLGVVRRSRLDGPHIDLVEEAVDELRRVHVIVGRLVLALRLCVRTEAGERRQGSLERRHAPSGEVLDQSVGALDGVVIVVVQLLCHLRRVPAQDGHARLQSQRADQLAGGTHLVGVISHLARDECPAPLVPAQSGRDQPLHCLADCAAGSGPGGLPAGLVALER